MILRECDDPSSTAQEKDLSSHGSAHTKQKRGGDRDADELSNVDHVVTNDVLLNVEFSFFFSKTMKQ